MHSRCQVSDMGGPLGPPGLWVASMRYLWVSLRAPGLEPRSLALAASTLHELSPLGPPPPSSFISWLFPTSEHGGPSGVYGVVRWTRFKAQGDFVP